MKRFFAFAAAGLLAGAIATMPLTATSSVAAEKTKREVVVKHPAHRAVVRTPARHTVVRKAAPRRVVVTRRYPRRQGQFWHRGIWHGRIHGPVYRWPHGWHYQVWRVGMILPPVLFVPDYYYDGYGGLGLQAPPPGYRWVRYGDDLLLVNLRTGAVEDVVYDVFD